jgi:hypothetical protein
MRSNLHDTEAEFCHQTDKAVLLKNAKGKEIWLPKSRCQIFPEEPSRGQTVTLTAEEALLTDKEFI